MKRKFKKVFIWVMSTLMIFSTVLGNISSVNAASGDFAIRQYESGTELQFLLRHF